MKAIDYIRKGWTQSRSAVTKNGRKCKARSPLAVAWCAYGAIDAVYSGDDYEKAVDKLHTVIGSHAIALWNDSPDRTKKEVIQAFEKAGI